MNQNEITLPPSLIILKNSIIEGSVPRVDNLEVGELALGLFPGKENIWAKNSEGSIVNLRSPRHDLYWGDLFIKYDTLDEFNTDLNAGKIKNTSIVFIKSSAQLWSDGTFYSSYYTEEELEAILENMIIYIPEEIFNLTNESTNEDIDITFGGSGKFMELVNRCIYKQSMASMKIPGGGSTPVTITPKFISFNEGSLTFEWIYNGGYNTMTVTLRENIFSIKRDFIDFHKQLEINQTVDKYLLNMNKPLVKPIISGNWTFYNYNNEPTTIPEVDINNPTIERGYKARFTGSYKWISNIDYKNPEKVITEESNWVDLPESNVESKLFNSEILDTNTLIKIKLAANRTGLIVSDDEVSVIPAEGIDYSEDRRIITFLDRCYFGNIRKDLGNINESDILGLIGTSLSNTRAKTFESLSLGMDEWFVYAYPATLGLSTSIIQDGFIPVAGAFEHKELMITSEKTGATIDMLVYVSNNPGAFTNVKLEFK